MAKKKINQRPDIIDEYMKYVLEHGKEPASIYTFAKAIGISELKFYDSYGSFNALEKSINKAFFDNTLKLLSKNKEYKSFDAQNKLLSFYYTFFEILRANRSYVIWSFRKESNPLRMLTSLSQLRKSFLEYVGEIGINTMDLKEEKLENIKENGIKEWAWAQLLFTLQFWIEDDSKGFDKTDILIEKSIATSFKLMDTSTLNSVFDLGKFLFKEKMMST